MHYMINFKSYLQLRIKKTKIRKESKVYKINKKTTNKTLKRIIIHLKNFIMIITYRLILKGQMIAIFRKC